MPRYHFQCTVDGCSKPHEAKGYCLTHYRRFQRHGTLAVSRASNGEHERYFHDVVLAYDGDECLLWPFSHNGNGYGTMRTGSKTVRVSRRVCEHVNGPPPTPKHDAAHSCGNGHIGCCTKRHMSWKTRSENLLERRIHKTFGRGTVRFEIEVPE